MQHVEWTDQASTLQKHLYQVCILNSSRVDRKQGQPVAGTELLGPESLCCITKSFGSAPGVPRLPAGR